MPGSDAVTDGNPATGWGSAATNPLDTGSHGKHSIQVDLGAEQPVDRVVLQWTQPDRHGAYYTMQTSVDGKQWDDVAYGPAHLRVPWGSDAAVFQPVPAAPHDPDMELLVNGVKVLCRGGNWGIDEALKRIPAKRIDAFVRLHRDAHLTMIRNWVGQSTGEEFYRACDRYGILVWNDFWLANPNDGPNPDDEDLFLDNARDVVRRYRNHPSIALWCARNEGWPPAGIDRGLARIIAEEDGTRRYQRSSDRDGVHGRGPYWYVPPQLYFSRFAHGFTTEIGLPSVPSADSIRAMMPASETWPANGDPSTNDTWNYHDFCRKGGMFAGGYYDALARRFGRPTSLEDFCRKAQMLNYESHRAIFEAWNKNLWRDSSGVLLWMSHPAWPSTVWQLYAYDLEPTSALFGAQKGCEPLHIQLNLDDSSVSVINHQAAPLKGLRASARAYSVDGKLLASKEGRVNAPGQSATRAFALPAPAPGAARLVKLELRDASGLLLSDNFYWQAAQEEDYRALNALPRVPLEVKVSARQENGRLLVTATVSNPSASPVLMARATLRRAASHERVLPAFSSENDLSLLPGEAKTVTIDCAVDDLKGEPAALGLDGWNAAQTFTPIP